MYKQTLKSKRDEFNKMINRYEVGLTIIENAQTKVSILQDQIKKDEPILEQLGKDLEVKSVELKQVLEVTNKKKEEVAQSSEIQDVKVKELEKMAAKINEDKQDTEKQKDRAMKLADSLSAKDITEVSS